MTTMQVATTLTAAESGSRKLKARLLTFGEEGRTSLGRVRVSAGRVVLPTNPREVHLNVEHDRNKPVGWATSITEEADGLHAEFEVANTTAGNDLLEEARTGLRAAASVELDDPVIRRGDLIGGRLSAVGAVVKPAYPSATLMVAADCGDLPTTQESTMADEATETEAVEAEANTEETEQEQEETTTEQPTQLAAARAPLGTQTPAMTGAKDRKHSVLTASQMLANLAKQDGGSTRMGTRLVAALAEITTTGTLDVVTPESFEGKVWQGREYERQFTQLILNEGLTSLKYRGWKWVDGSAPVMSAYAGFPAEPPTGPVEAEETDWEPDMYGGAWQLDRKHRDFSDPEWWNEFFISTATSYSQESDQDVLAALVAGATATPVTIGDKPADVPEGLWKLIKGIRAVKGKGLATFGILEWDLWEEVMFTPQDAILPYLKLAMGVESGQALNFQIKPDDSVLTAGQVLVGVDKAAKFRELPGASPIRIDAELISKGGIEQGVFAYAGTQIREPGGFALVEDQV